MSVKTCLQFRLKVLVHRACFFVCCWFSKAFALKWDAEAGDPNLDKLPAPM